MNTEWKEKWIAALRSGNYNQARHCLKNYKSRGYCCLGVLEELARPASRQLAKKNDGRSRGGYLSKMVTESTGVRRRYQRVLARMNDGGRSFGEIVDYIEREL